MRERHHQAGEAAAAKHALVGSSADKRRAVRRKGRVLVLLCCKGCERGDRPSVGTINSGRSSSRTHKAPSRNDLSGY
jgi:hypothetical protein